MEIAGMCLPLKPQKESVSTLHGSLLQFFHVSQPGMDVRVSDGFSTSSMLINNFLQCKQGCTAGGLEAGGLDGSQGFRRGTGLYWVGIKVIRDPGISKIYGKKFAIKTSPVAAFG
jgi:hypothetical protein